MSTVSTTGNGINATGQSNVVIRNGIIMGFGGAAIVTGIMPTFPHNRFGQFERAGAGASIQAGNGSQIVSNTVTGSGSGISCGIGCVARDNIIQGNTGVGTDLLRRDRRIPRQRPAGQWRKHRRAPAGRYRVEPRSARISATASPARSATAHSRNISDRRSAGHWL